MHRATAEPGAITPARGALGDRRVRERVLLAQDSLDYLAQDDLASWRAGA